MITITTTIKNTQEFLRKAQVNIRRSQTALATRLTKEAKFYVEVNAPVWQGTLKDKVAMKIFPRTHKGEVFMASSMYDMIAQQNEFNPRGKRKLYKSAYPKLARWADDKGVFRDKPYVIVGGSGTRLGKRNKFFEPAFNQVQNMIPSIAEEVIAKAIMRTRG